MKGPRPTATRLKVAAAAFCFVSVLVAGIMTSSAMRDYDAYGLSSYAPSFNKLGLSQTDTLRHEVKTVESDNNLQDSILSTSKPAQSSVVLTDSNSARTFADSKGQIYQLTLAEQDYLDDALSGSRDKAYFQTRDGKVVSVFDDTKYVQTNAKLAALADELYLNAGSDYQFLYEVRYIVTNYFEYSPDQIERASLPTNTLLSGKGDCEDLTILMASILLSSSYTKDWEIKMVYFDANNPQEATTANHVALFIKTDGFTTFVESTNPDLNGLDVWHKVDGWYVDVSRTSST